MGGDDALRERQSDAVPGTLTAAGLITTIKPIKKLLLTSGGKPFGVIFSNEIDFAPFLLQRERDVSALRCIFHGIVGKNGTQLL